MDTAGRDRNLMVSKKGEKKKIKKSIFVLSFHKHSNPHPVRSGSPSIPKEGGIYYELKKAWKEVC